MASEKLLSHNTVIKYQWGYTAKYKTLKMHSQKRKWKA